MIQRTALQHERQNVDLKQLTGAGAGINTRHSGQGEAEYRDSAGMDAGLSVQAVSRFARVLLRERQQGRHTAGAAVTPQEQPLHRRSGRYTAGAAVTPLERCNERGVLSSDIGSSGLFNATQETACN